MPDVWLIVLTALVAVVIAFTIPINTRQAAYGPKRQSRPVLVTVPSRSPHRPKQADEALYEIRELTKTYGIGVATVHALRGVSLSIQREATAITGPNGSGKSTLMNILGALDMPTSGSVAYCGQQMLFHSRRAMNDFRFRVPAFVLQDLNLFQDQNALDNVAFSVTRYGESYRFASEAAKEQLDLLGIDAKMARRLPKQLSGGQRQRVAIARALLANKYGGAEVILADEPTAAVDSKDAEDVFQAFLDLAREQNVPVIVVTHNEELAARADRVLVCKHGRVSEA